MKEDIKYPYIGKDLESSTVVLMLKPECGVVIKSKTWATKDGKLETSIDESYIANVTHEYLANTYGKVDSKEHAEFIVELAENAGFEVRRAYKQGFAFFSFWDGKLAFLEILSAAKAECEKQITIPMPPKEVKAVDEWPKANCEFQHKESKKKGIILCVDGSFAWCKYPYMNPVTIRISDIQKPKTPEEELQDELIDIIDNASCSEQAAEYIVKTYLTLNTKKPQ